MNDDRKKISRFVHMLQTQTQLPLWSLANEHVIYSVAIDQKPIWGKKTNVLNKLAKLCNKIHAGDVLIFAVALLRVMSIWCKNYFKKPHVIGQYQTIFAGFGASAEEYMYANCIKERSTIPLRINMATHDGIHELGLGLSQLWIAIVMLFRVSFGYSKKLQAMHHKLQEHAAEFLTVCAMHAGVYAFYRAFWQLAKVKEIKEVIFLTPDIPAFACVDEGLFTCYWQHGLMSSCLLFPQFNYTEVLTRDEKKYLEGFLKGKITKNNLRNEIEKKNNTILVLSPDVFLQQRLPQLEALSQWAKQNHWGMVLRTLPTVRQSDLDILMQKFPEACFDNTAQLLEESLITWCPKIVASWLSTGLALALEYGFLPITLCEESIDKEWWNMIYPMKHRVLFWSRDHHDIEQAAQSEAAYLVQINKLNSYHDSL